MHSSGWVTGVTGRPTLATCPRKSWSSPSSVRFSLRAVLRAASLELRRASRSLSRAWAASKSPSFLVLLGREESVSGSHLARTGPLCGPPNGQKRASLHRSACIHELLGPYLPKISQKPLLASVPFP